MRPDSASVPAEEDAAPSKTLSEDEQIRDLTLGEADSSKGSDVEMSQGERSKDAACLEKRESMLSEGTAAGSTDKIVVAEGVSVEEIKDRSSGQVAMSGRGSDFVGKDEASIEKNEALGDNTEAQTREGSGICGEERQEEAGDDVEETVGPTQRDPGDDVVVHVAVKDVSGLETGERMLNDEISLSGGDVSLEASQAQELKEVGEEAMMGDGSVMDRDSDRKESASRTVQGDVDRNIQEASTALDTVSVDDGMDPSEADVMKVSNTVDLAGCNNEEGDLPKMCNDQEASVSNICAVDTDQRICDEGNTASDPMPVDGIAGDLVEAAEPQVCSADNHQTIKEEGNVALDSDPKPVDPVVVGQPQVTGRAEMGMELVIDGNQCRDPEANVPEMLLIETKQNVQEEGANILDPVPLNSTASKANSDEKDTYADPVVEKHSKLTGEQTTADPEEIIEGVSLEIDQAQESHVVGVDTEVDYGSLIDHDSGSKNFISQMASSDFNKNIQEEGSTALRSGSMDDGVELQEADVVEDSNLTNPLGKQHGGAESENEVGDGSEMHVNQEVSVSHVSSMDTDQNIADERNATLGSVPVDGIVDDLVEEAKTQVICTETEVGEGSVIDHKAPETPFLPVTIVHNHQNIQEQSSVAFNPTPADPVVELQPQVMGKDGYQGKDLEARVRGNSLTESEQKVREEGLGILDPIPVDSTLHQADIVENDPNPVVEVNCKLMSEYTKAEKEAEACIESSIDGDRGREPEASIPDTSLESVIQNAQEEGESILEPVPVDSINHHSDTVVEDPNPADAREAPIFAEPLEELRPNITGNEVVMGDGSPLHIDREMDQNASVSETSFVVAQETGNEALASSTFLSDNDENIPEGGAVLGSVSFDGITDHHENKVEGEQNLAGAVVEEQASVGDDSMIDVDQNNNREASDVQMPLVETNEDIQKETEIHEADHGTEGPNPINPVEEEHEVIEMEGKVGDMSIIELDQDGNISLVGTISIPYDDTISHPIDPIANNLNPADVNVEAEFIQDLDANQEALCSVATSNLENTDGEQKALVREEVLLKETEKEDIQSVEEDQHVTYSLHHCDKERFSFSDLVWGKVKSHPWWPGQIFDHSDATKLAMKYQKKDAFLIAYYGDKTFAWCDDSQLKPFISHFSQLEKQYSSDTFVKAIHDILIELSRRVDLGMACSCFPEEEYSNIKYQKIENAGIRGGDINSVIDRPTIINYFQPEKLVEYMKTLAQFPNGNVDRLEFLIAQSQLKALHRSKGYRELPAFIFTGGVMENVAEDSPSDLISDKGKSKIEESSFDKRELDFKDDGKQKNILKSKEDRTDGHLLNGGKSKSAVAKASEKRISSSSGKKHIVVESDPVDSGRCKKRTLDSFEDIEFKSPSSTVSSSFKIGEFICRAASQLTGAPPLVKCQGETRAEHKKDDVADFDALPYSPTKKERTNLSLTEDYNSTDDMLSQLYLAAGDPMNEFTFVTPIISFFTGFRDFCAPDSSEDKEHVEKHKRGRPRREMHETSSDISLSDDEKHVEKRKRGMLMKNMISQLASSDISSEEEKPEEKPVVKRKRGRPRKNPEPKSPSSSDEKKLVQRGKRGRAKKLNTEVLNTQLVSPDYSSSENKKPVVEKRKRGRPKKVKSEIAPTDIPILDPKKDSYWSDPDLQKERNGKSPIQYQRKRRKSTGEQQLQLVAMKHNTKHAFVTERSIISVDEKIVDECVPTALILSFNNANSLPSETDLIRIFSRYGPLKEAETDVLRKTNRAKVVFKRRVDAETAFSSAGKYSTFGPGLLSYQLKPWTPKSTLIIAQQENHDATPIDTQQENPDATPIDTQQENPDATPVATSEDNHDQVPITITQANHDAAPSDTPQENHNAASVATSEDKHEMVLTTMTHDNYEAHNTMVEENHDASFVVSQQENCYVGPNVGSNIVLSEQEEAVTASDHMEVEAVGKESSSQCKNDEELIATAQEIHDAASIATSEVRHDLVPITMAQDDHDFAPISTVEENLEEAAIITQQEICGAGTTEGSSLELSEQEDAIAVDAESNESLLQCKHDPALIATPQENYDAASIAIPEDKHGVLPISMSQADHELAPATMVDENHDVASIITLREKCDADLSENAETVIMSDIMEVETDVKESSPWHTHDPTLVATPQENQNEEPVTSLIDGHDLTPTTTQENLDAAAISMPQDTRDAAPITRPQENYDAVLTEGGNLNGSEQADPSLALATMQVEAEGDKLDVSELANPSLATETMQVEAEGDNLEVSEPSLASETMQVQAEGDKSEVLEQPEPSLATENIQVEAEGDNLRVSEAGTTTDAMQVEAEGDSLEVTVSQLCQRTVINLDDLNYRSCS